MKRAGTVLACLTLLVGVMGVAQATDSLHFLNKRLLKRRAMLAEERGARGGFLPSEVECRRSGTSQDLNLDCDDRALPNNEPHIVVDPEDPKHMIASSNDYDSCCDGFYTTFNGGRTWIQGDMSAESKNVIGSDPVTTIDPKSGNAIHSSLNFGVTQEGLAVDGDVVASISRDGGVTWREPVVVQHGSGDDDDPVQLFNDKEWIVTDTDPDSPFYGRTYLTWSRFRSEFGEYRESPIWEAHSDDGGETWSRPHEISGSRAALCDFQVAGPRGECDQNQFSVPTVTPDGTVYVAFQNEQNSELWERGERCTPDTNCESQYLVVSSDDGGKTWSRPTFVVGLEDSGRDYPKNVDGRITLTRYQIRVNSAGNIVADPGSGRLYLVFSDNRAGKHDSAHPVTDTNVYITWSDDGTSWHRPEPVSTRPTDQWFPWVEVDPTNGDIGVIYHDRTREGAYDTTLAEGKPGSWTYTKLTTRTSHPNNSLFFRATAEGCRKCATFHGDYLGLDYGSDGKVNLVWTDMRRLIDVGTANGYTENIFFSRL